MSVDKDRLELIVLARRASSLRVLSETAIVDSLSRFQPAGLEAERWFAHVRAAAEQTRAVDSAAAFMKRTGLPRVPSWRRMVERVLPGLAIGVPADARLDGRDGWTAAIAAKFLGLWSAGPPPSLSAVGDAFAWRSLGLPGKPKRCPPEIRAMFVQRELQTEAASPERLLRLFVARELGVVRSELGLVRSALVARWLQHIGFDATEAFLAEVRTVVSSPSEGAFGDRKVFIASAWNQMRRKPSWSQLTLDSFKERLTQARRAGAVELARADLVSAMDPSLVASSEIQDHGATFHLIVRGDS